MRKTRFTEHQIIGVLTSVGARRTVKDICRKADIQNQLLQLERKYGGIEALGVKKIKDPEDENHCLKPMVADLSPENRARKDVIEKSVETIDKVWTRPLSDQPVRN